MQVITSTGFGDSGSSAITDLLSEYEGIKSYGSEWECTFLHMPDGLADLEEAVKEGHRLKVDFAIQRFLRLSKKLSAEENYQRAFQGKFFELARKFIEELCDIKWNGMYEERFYDFYNELNIKQKKSISFAKNHYRTSRSKQFDMYESDSWRPDYVPCAEMFYICNLQKFYECAKKYTNSLFKLAVEKNQSLYLDQLLPSADIKKYLNYFTDEIKIFIVDKDPRDLFLVENLFNGSRFIPYESAETYIKWYKLTRSRALEYKNAKSIYFCRLDDLVFDYKNQCKQIEKFLGLKAEQHTKALQKFDPQKSAANIRLYEKYDNFQEEIKLIKTKLKSFLAKDYLNAEGKSKSAVEKKHFEKPIVNIIKTCNEIQKGRYKSLKISSVILSTLFFNELLTFSNRKSAGKIIKGIIKILIGIIVFIPELIYNIFVIFI